LPDVQVNLTVSHNDDAFHALVNQGIDLMNEGCYQEALESCKNLILYYPESPVGYFYTAACYQTIMRNYRVRTFEPEFKRYINLAIETGEAAVKKDRRDAISSCYLGGAYGYKALHKVLNREWLSAFRDGKRNISHLEEAIKTEPTLYDAYYGLGVYHYWRSAKSKALWFLPFIGDERQKGIAELWQAIHKGRHSAIEGRYALTTIYYNEADYQKAWEVNQQLHNLFPNSPACLYMRGRILEKQGKWKRAEMTFRRLLNHLIASEYRSISYQIECHYHLAFYLAKQKQFDPALRECELALQLSKLQNPAKELEGHLESTEEILDAAHKLHRQLVKINALRQDNLVLQLHPQ
jgi:tetratricopeptide (TPR) repeat protein